MDLLYSELSFRKYFNFFDKYKIAVATDIMQQEPFDVRIAGLENTLQKDSNKTQVQCCLYELADLLDKADSEQLKAIDDDIQDVILTNMNRYLTDVEIQRDGIFGLYSLMKDNQQIQNKLKKSRFHYCIVQRMFSHPNDVIIQAIGCRIISILVANNDTVKKEIIAVNAVDVIINAIDTFDNEDDLQLWAMQALTHVLQSNTEEQDKFLQQEYYLLVLERIEKLKEYSILIEQVFKLFTVLTESSCFMQYFRESELAVVFQFMEYHEECRDVQFAGISFLIELAKNMESHKCLVMSNIDVIMFRVQAKFPNCAISQRKCIELFNLLCESLLDTSENRECRALQCLNGIMIAMATHWDDMLLLIMACESVSVLCTHHPDLLLLIDDEHDEHVPLHNTIMASLALHIDDEKMCESALMAIALSATQSSAIQKELFMKGVYIHIVKAMEKHSQIPGVQQYGCQALRILSLSSLENMMEIIGSEAWEVVTRCIQSFKDEPEVLQEAIAIIACFAADLEAIRNQCAIEKLYLPALQAMQTYKDNATLIEMAFEFIGVLSACEAMPELFMSEGAVTIFLNAMNHHADHLNIQQKGCILVQVFSSYLTTDTCIKAVSAVILAMQKFQFVECIQEEACVALKLIAQVSLNFSEIEVNQCAHERLFVILDEFRTRRRLIQLASEVLWFLGCSRMLNSRMLLSACADGLVRGAHCLIQLEADVNVGENYNTPLCAACKNNKEEMVRFLLTQGIKDVHTALGLCLEMEHHNLVGLLLQKMGHDRESGIISWSGLNLGSIRPEWLAPSLSGKAFGLAIETERYCNYIQCAEKAFKQRFKVLQKFTDLASVGGNVNPDDIHKFIAETISDGEEDDEFSFPTSDDGSITDEQILTDKVPLRARSLTGASLPYSSYDPRVVLPLTVGDPILLPKRSQPNANNISVLPMDLKQRRTKSWLDTPDTECDDTFSESFNSQDSKTSTSVGKQRSKSDVDQPSYEFPRMAFMFDNAPYRRRRVSEVSDESVDGRKNSVGRRGRRKTTIMPRGQTDATVCVIDISKNSISDLSLLAEAGDSVLGYLFNVVKLDLSYNQLSDLPCELCENMPNLKQVSLSNNNFKVFPFHLIEAPRLRVLDISSNCLELQENPPDDASRSILLEHLSLANNHLKTFPKWLASFFPGLTSLSVSENELQEFPETGEKMQFLKTLDVSKNAITSIPVSFLDQFKSLETLNASYNGLSNLPESQTDCDSNLTTLRLAHNKLTEEKPFFIPKFILRLPKLKVLDISYNQLTCLPPLEIWKTNQLNQLDVSHNNIQRINFDTVNPTKWSSLERLNLRGNNLKDVPKGIGLMTSLTSLDLSDNPGITSLPDEMGRLSNLWDLPLAGLKLDLEESLVTNTKKLVAFFNSKLLNSVPYYRMKLVTVGLEKRGKTTLLNQLLRSKSSQSANELDIRDWTLRDGKATCKQCHHKSVIYTINTWDLKGREDMYQAFQCFMTSRTLYLAVYDVTNGGQELDALRPWLQTIHACAPNVPVMLVGTHWDKVPSDKMNEVKNEMKDRARMLFSSPGLPDIKAHVVLNCTQETAGIQALRTSIVDLVVKCKCVGHSILGSRVPQKFVHIQELIEKVKMDDNRKGRWLTKLELKRLLQDNDVLMTDSELGQAVKFLHEAGVLLHYDDPVAHLNDLFFTDPVWLNNLVSSVVVANKHSKHNALVANGIVSRNGLIELIDEDIIAIVESFLPQFLRLLERFGVAVPITESEVLIPSRVQTLPPSNLTLPDLASNSLYRRFYDLAFVPLGFWSRLITRLLLFLPMMDVDKNDIRYPSSLEYWKTGIQVIWSSESFFTVFQDTSGQFGVNLLAIAVPTNDQGSFLLGNLVDHVDALIEEWYPTLCDLDPVQGQPLVTRLCPCITCEGETCHVFTLEECIEQALRYEEIVCPRTSQFLPVVKVAPDVELADLKLQNLLIKEEELALQQKKECVLGDGSFGTVYKAKCNDRVVAVKVFRTEGHIDPHRLLRQEVPFLAHLRHPSIITLHGVCVRPRALILEIAPLGSLSSLLNKGEVLSRGLQHRIALQVAEGLSYLHRNKIVYRDMKPHNILMFSLALSIVINAKISDFGIARYTALYGLKSSEGTPGYRAPEVVRGDSAYNKEADIYSFGMLLYELVTGGKRPFEDVRFRNELDAAVMQGKMIDPITDSGSSPWPDIEDLIEHLLQPRADMRPTADQVVERLSSPELLCLKRTIAVSKGKAVESIAVRSNDGNVELWMGSGVTGHYGCQVSWLSLTQSTNEGCQGTFMKDKRVTSLAAVHNDFILVGTQSGTIWVFDAVSRTCKHSLKVLPDSVVSLRHYYNSKTYDDLVIAGLANGSLVIYKTKHIKNANAEGEIMHLCKTINDGGSCRENCNVHAVACLTVAKRCLYCGCGNDILILTLGQGSVEFKRRWSVEDRRSQCVLNISVSSFIWTSTKDSPYIDFWDISEPVLRGTINCATIISTSANIPRKSRDMRILCMLIEQNTIWVGLGTGHVIALSTKSREPLYVLKRHTGPVRCLAIARRSSRHGKPVSLLMTGGKGFIDRPGFKSNDQDFGYVLVWEADLAEQKKRLLDDKTKRQQMQCTELIENASSLDYTSRSIVKNV